MFEHPCIKGAKFTDAMAGKYNYLDVNRYAQVLTNYSFFTAAYLMDKKSLAGQGLRGFITYFGVMEHLLFDGSK